MGRETRRETYGVLCVWTNECEGYYFDVRWKEREEERRERREEKRHSFIYMACVVYVACCMLRVLCGMYYC